MSIALCSADQGEWVTVSTHNRSDWNALQECLSCCERSCCYCSQLDSYRPTRWGMLFNGKQGPSQYRQKMIIDQILPVFRAFSWQAWAGHHHEQLTHPRLLYYSCIYNLFLFLTNSEWIWENMFWLSDFLCNLTPLPLSTFFIDEQPRKQFWSQICFKSSSVFFSFYRPQNFVSLCCYFSTSEACMHCCVNNEKRSCKRLNVYSFSAHTCVQIILARDGECRGKGWAQLG